MEANDLENLRISEKDWYFLAVLASIFTLVATVFAAIWVFSEPILDNRAKMVSTLAPFGTIPLAFVTFCTVAWRGMVSTRQADEQRRANDAKDEENIAKLMLDATKLLTEDKSTSRLSGIAALATIAISKQESFAAHCMNMLADQAILANESHGDTNIFRAAQGALAAGYSAGRIAKRQLKIDFSKRRTNFEAIEGVETVVYENGELFGSDVELLLALSSKTNVRLERCTITDAIIDRSEIEFQKCRFIDCRCKFISGRQMVNNVFEDCDFSDAVLRFKPDTRYLAMLKDGGNYYDDGKPPRTTSGRPYPFPGGEWLDKRPSFEFEDLGPE